MCQETDVFYGMVRISTVAGSMRVMPVSLQDCVNFVASVNKTFLLEILFSVLALVALWNTIGNGEASQVMNNYCK